MREGQRIVAIMHGSDSDLEQMIDGLGYLRQREKQGLIRVLWIDSNSQHRHTPVVEQKLQEYAKMPGNERPDIIITGAGWANHLSGCVDSYLRYTLKEDTIVIFAVGFEDQNNIDNTMAAKLSITQVPGTQAIFKGIGSKGFLQACVDAVEGELPFIRLKEPPSHARRTLREAMTLALTNREKKMEMEKLFPPSTGSK